MNQSLKDIVRLKEQAVKEAEKLGGRLDETKRVAFIACSYDTSFESVKKQVVEKVDQLVKAYGLNGKVSWSLWLVDDLPAVAGFSRAVQDGFNAVSNKLGEEGRLKLIKMRSEKPMSSGLKGRALLDGMFAALEDDPGLAALVYMNLNLKVDACFSAEGLRQVLCEGFDAAIGTRSPEKGGLVIGRGIAGNLKSRFFNFLIRMLLPPIKTYYDTNAPMKVYNPEAAGLLVRSAVLPTVSMDCEWLMLLHLNGYQVARFPIAWVQRFGSRPPWHMILPCFMDILKIRKRWKLGRMSPAKKCV
jgi:hypothetical protein